MGKIQEKKRLSQDGNLIPVSLEGEAEKRAARNSQVFQTVISKHVTDVTSVDIDILK